ncbi:uncharacterized protein LOC113494322 [Trichoplusia ni]|uniref:Uncharacterized protein LOC113494322 n=1 Tax=Trichoplusia ni TaxID=7111 RepID=A0A7E5VJE5_TRINI|nr:uncharacterized protein LOC113494322 [Trichoplusia ni]
MLFLLLTIFVLISNVAAKLAYIPDPFENRFRLNDLIQPIFNFKLNYFSGDPLWVIELSSDNFIQPKLRLGNSAEMDEFYKYIAPLISAAQRRQLSNPNRSPTQQTPNPAKPSDAEKQETIHDIKKDFLGLVNKFILSTNVVPDAYLMDDTYHTDPTVALYFKGPYTSLKVRAGRKQWNYFIEQGPKFDDWFYENHDTADSPISVPGSVEINLFSTVLKYLKLMFRFHLNHQA